MIDKFLDTPATSLRLRAQRTQILASNIANADTPNYKARDIAFAEVLRDVQSPGGNTSQRDRLSPVGGSLHTTNSRHITTGNNRLNPEVLYRQPEQASLDGNTVDKDIEQARFAENTVRYQATLQHINSRVSGLIKALRGE